MWLQFMTVVPMILSAVSLIFMLLIARYIRHVTQQCDTIISSTHSLARCAVRLKVGPSAKKSIKEYARANPELRGLLREDTLNGSTEQTI
ncbi:hypothetical protein OESDEN_22830 [Oesophagostomum dentatum]|uniref:Uncharacterized protein n=1 Tax=Oesophagostomum dentatum TaxID=61180 RepID=A0A0B1S2V1_OESDE|nr:hypothetical protein OESDEN_22830 [Oesophagostomum dentatum]